MQNDFDIHQIDTPENISLAYDVAGIGSRFLAAFWDYLIMAIVLVAGNILFYMSFRNSIRYGEIPQSVWVIVIGLLNFMVQWGYYIFFEMVWNGQTPGKRRIGLRVIRSSGEPITLALSLIRNLFRVLDFLPFLYGVGMVAMFIDRRSRRLGDLVADTLVVHDRAAPTLEQLGSLVRYSSQSAIPQARPAQAKAQGSWDHLNAQMTASTLADDAYPFERITKTDAQLAANYLSRRHSLVNQEALARQLYQSFCQRMETPASSQASMYEMENLIKKVASCG